MQCRWSCIKCIKQASILPQKRKKYLVPGVLQIEHNTPVSALVLAVSVLEQGEKLFFNIHCYLSYCVFSYTKIVTIIHPSCTSINKCGHYLGNLDKRVHIKRKDHAWHIQSSIVNKTDPLGTI